MMDSIYVEITSRAQWEAFAEANREALLEVYPDLSAALDAARNGGVEIGGGAAPLCDVHVTF